MPKLTKTVVEKAELQAKPYFLWCSELSGFGVRIWPTGKRVYCADYRSKAGLRRRITIGPHGKLTTEEARKLAVVTLADALKGEDPALERATRRKSLTLAELCDTYVQDAERGFVLGKGGRAKKPSTLYVDRGRIERHIKPLLGRKLVIDLVPADIAKFIRDVMAGKTAADVKTGRKRGRSIVEGGAGTATRTAGLLGGILSYAVMQGIIAHNPARGMKRPADGKRTRRLTAAEYRALGDALASPEADGDAPQGVAGVWLLALTGCRLGEIAALKWSEVDLDGEALRLGDSKTGASTRPLSQLAIAVLRRLRRVEGNAYVLPATRAAKAHFGGLSNAVERVMARAKLSGVTAHTLRHSFASVGDDLGFTENTIGSIVGHKGNSITSRYIHKLDAVLVAAANRIATEVHRQMTNTEEGEPAADDAQKS